MKKYYREIDGKLTYKAANKITVLIEKAVTRQEKVTNAEGKEELVDVERMEEFRVFNPSHEQILADGWTEYVIPEPTVEELLARAKMLKTREIDAYDKSSTINSFYYGNVEYWLDRDTRVSVRSTAEIMKDMGKQTMTLWLGDVNVTLAPEQVLQMLAVLEVYALECYNKTAEHKAAVNALTTLEEVEAYDYTIGYPEKINF